MTILITGASGFIGSRLVSSACRKLDAKNIIAFSSKAVHACPSIIYSGLNYKLSSAEHALLETAEVLIHLGAFTPKNGQQTNAIDECNSNISFTERILSLPLNNLKKIIYISTLDVYKPDLITTENTLTIPSSMYGWSKLYCERMTAIYAEQNKLTYQLLRIGHVYGPGEEKYAKFIPNAIKKILADEPIELWGDGSEIRSFIYIDDVVKAILRAVTLDNNMGPINVVGGNPITIKELIGQLILVSGKVVDVNKREFNGEKRSYIFDNSKLRKCLLTKETDLKIGLQSEYSYMASLL
jgi:UDP-glucose 4-epimerase